MRDAARADIAGDRIVLQAPLAATLLCGRIPGARWDRCLHAWTYPATERHARLITVAIRQLQPTPAFNALTEVPAAECAVAGPEVRPDTSTDSPQGLSVCPWRHQITAFQFCVDKFAGGLFGLLLAMGMGTGKTLVALMLMLERKAMRTLIVCPLRVVPVLVEPD